MVSYAESDDDDDDDAFDPAGIKSRPSRSRKTNVLQDSEDEDTFVAGDDGPLDEDGKNKTPSIKPG
jgi:DNA mismatch repair protein MSH6